MADPTKKNSTSPPRWKNLQGGTASRAMITATHSMRSCHAETRHQVSISTSSVITSADKKWLLQLPVPVPVLTYQIGIHEHAYMFLSQK